MKMVPISSLNSRIFEKKKGFKNFAWALGYGGMTGQTFDMYQKTRKKIPHLLIWIYRAQINAEKRYAEKTTQKWILRGLKLRGLT